MALLLGAQDLAKAYGAAPLFAGLSFGIHDGDRIGLVGPNGSGKSTLLRILSGAEPPDAGTVALRRQARLAYVPQHPAFPGDTPVGALVEAACVDAAVDDALRAARVRQTLARCGLGDPAAMPATLSGGWQKRLAIALALARSPDLLLMDEPTNHLDVDGILWLEEVVLSAPAASVFVSHDRWFLEHVATRMLDLDAVHARGFFESRGRYSDFLERKETALRAQAREEETLANRVRREVEWLRRGPKARTTKAQARIREAGRLVSALADVQERQERRTTAIEFDASERRTRRLVVAEHVAKRFGDRRVFDDASIVLGPGSRLALVGPNGSGKSTLLRVLVGELPPDAGRVTHADRLRVAMLDQHRTSVDPSVTLARALAPEGDQVVFAGRPVHVAGWARRFLFRPEQLAMPVGRLSGGEQARVHLARLMLAPADLLVLDEPTNDLDIPTLEVLEESLLEFPGAVILVTHDRYLLERVATSVLALDGTGAMAPFADYAQWEASRRERPVVEPKAAAVRPARAPAKSLTKSLTWGERRELEGMEAAILAAEADRDRCDASAHDPAVASDAGELAARCRALQEASDAVDRLYARWAALDAKRR